MQHGVRIDAETSAASECFAGQFEHYTAPSRTLVELVSGSAPPGRGFGAARRRTIPRPGAIWQSALPSPQRPPGTDSTRLPDLEPGEAAHCGSRLGKQLPHRLLGVAYRRLLDQRDVLEEGVQPSLDDLSNRLFRLTLLAGHLLGDPALIRHGFLGNLVPSYVLRAHSGHLVRDVHRDRRARIVDVDEHAESWRQSG